MKKVLVIGGSMFTGRLFSILASRSGDYDLYVANRGNYPLNLERVTQIICDRHDARALAELAYEEYDAVIDFCAYEPGDVKTIVDAPAKIRHYILISTASVYAPGDGFLGEDSRQMEIADDEADEELHYIAAKQKLERELAAALNGAGIAYTILRPSFIYGPFNYAPREPYFIELIAKKRAVPFPVDASSRFNFVYAPDVASALMRCIGDERAYGAFNLAGVEALTYRDLMSVFESCNGGPFDKRDVTVAQADAERIPLPFPLTGDSLIDGGKFARTFGFEYTSFAEGMAKTFSIFHSIYSG